MIGSLHSAGRFVGIGRFCLVEELVFYVNLWERSHEFILTQYEKSYSKNVIELFQGFTTCHVCNSIECDSL